MSFEDQVFSKVILSGEHAVLRGGIAVVTPLKSDALVYSLSTDEPDFQFEYSDEVKPFSLLIEGTFAKAFELLEVKKEELKALVKVQSLVPLGKGLGGSAALCVFVSRVMTSLGLHKKENEFSFSVELENMFHGESSGVDIAGCLSSGPQSFQRGKALKPLSSKLVDVLFGVSDTGENGDTEDCIQRVLKIKFENKNLFYSLDSDMNEASRNLSQAIETGDTKLLVDSIEKGCEVFRSWGLVTEKMDLEMTKLKNAGALAVKPTGSGLGGCILSVWSSPDWLVAQEHCSKVFEL